MTEKEAYGQSFQNGRNLGRKEGFEKGKREADARNQPKSPYIDDNVLACPRCDSGEYLHNEDGNLNQFCGNCGQALDWGVKRSEP